MVALNAIVDALERNQASMRRLEAEQTRLLAEAFDLAAHENDAEGPVPVGERAELALRAIRAELALVLQLGERAVDGRLSTAYALRRQYSRVLEALEDGEIAYRHASVIVDAGRVIGSGDDPATVFRRGAYSDAMLAAARETTPGRLAPIARRSAEQYAEESLEKRHERASEQRRVWVEDRADGMADLYAHLPAAEAYGIYDRLTGIAKHVIEAEQARLGGAGQLGFGGAGQLGFGGAGQPGLSGAGQPGLSGAGHVGAEQQGLSRAGNTGAGLTGDGQPGLTGVEQRGLGGAGNTGAGHTGAEQRGLTGAEQRGLTGAGQQGLTGAGNTEPGRTVRSRDQVRADALCDLLLTGEPSEVHGGA